MSPRACIFFPKVPPFILDHFSVGYLIHYHIPTARNDIILSE